MSKTDKPVFVYKLRQHRYITYW